MKLLEQFKSLQAKKEVITMRNMAPSDKTCLFFLSDYYSFDFGATFDQIAKQYGFMLAIEKPRKAEFIRTIGKEETSFILEFDIEDYNEFVSQFDKVMFARNGLLLHQNLHLLRLRCDRWHASILD